MLFQRSGSGWSQLIQNTPRMLSFLLGLLFISGISQGLPCISPQKWHHYSVHYFHVPATVLQSSWAGGNSCAPMPESREQVESSMGFCSCTVIGVAWHGLQPKNPGRKAKAQAQCHGTTALSGKESGGKGPLLPWHRSCVRSDGLCSPAGVDSCFHFSVPRALVQRLRVNTRKWITIFVCLVTSWFP